MKHSNTENSVRLFDVISAGKKKVMFSPLSLNMAFGLVELGAKGKTKAEIDSYLQAENYADIAENYLKFIKEERTREEIKDPDFGVDPCAVLDIANSLWADNSLPVKEDYKRQVIGKFNAEIENLDFSDTDNTVKRINGWVNEKTRKMIPSIVSEFDPKTAAVLINTVYFESAWVNEWNINQNKKEKFTLFDNSLKKIPLMHKKLVCYFENGKAKAFGCGYINGLTFIGILPKKTGEFTLEELDIPSLLESKGYDYDVTAAMPRLNFKSEFKLRGALCKMGLGSVFSEKEADFSGISDVQLYISEVLQKTKLELDENGTKAAAATVMAVRAMGLPIPKEQKSVMLDRPFAFMIYDENKDQILFIGKVTEP